MDWGVLRGFLLLGVLPLAAQDAPLTCEASAQPLTIRAEGTTEQTGDVVIKCIGGTPTAPGATVPKVDVRLRTGGSLGITATPSFSGYFIANLTDALLLVDEPQPAQQTLCGSPAFPYSVPIGSNQPIVPGVCSLYGAPGGDGVGTYDPNVLAPAGTYRGNVFQARRNGADSILWLGVPLDPPGSAALRVIRITNVRVNASQLGVSRGQVPVYMFTQITSADGSAITLTNPRPTVAIARESLDFSVSQFKTCLQCDPFNQTFANNPSGALEGSSPVDSQYVQLRYSELFPTVFKRRNQAQPVQTSSGVVPGAPISQDVLGTIYNTESGLVKITPSSRWPAAPPGWPAIGLADTGTRLVARFNNVQAGVQLWVPRFVTSGDLTIRLDAAVTGNPSYVRLPLTQNAAGENRGEASWEVLNSNANAIESVDIGVLYAWSALNSVTSPVLGTTSVHGSYKPLSTVIPGAEVLQRSLPGKEPQRSALAYDKVRVPGFNDETAGAPGRRGVATLTIVDCAMRDQIVPRLAVTTGALPLVYFQQGNLPDPFQVYLLAGGKEITGINFENTTPWLKVEKFGDTTPVTFRITPDPSALAPGSYTGPLRITGNGIGAATVTIPLTVNPPGPHVTRWGVTNTASYEANVVSAGEALTIFGQRFGPDALAGAQFSGGKFATLLGETRVLFDGVAAPLLYAAREQVSAITPFAVEGKESTVMEVEYRGVKSPGVRFVVAPAVPGLLTADASGTGQAAALNEDNSFNSQVGALPGQYVVVFGVGGPKTDQPGRDGELNTAPLGKFAGPVTVLLDGVEVPAADVAYVGPAPGLVQGVWQANVRIGANAVRSSKLQIQLRFGDYVTQPGVVVSVR